MRIANLTFSILLSFLTSYGQNALYLEYKGSSKGEDKQTYTLKIYSLDSSSINELTDLEYPARPIKTLYQKTVPDTSFTLYENGTYSKFPDTQLPEYKIEVIVKENINGLSCTKVKLITRGESYAQQRLYKNWAKRLVLKKSLHLPNLRIASKR